VRCALSFADGARLAALFSYKSARLATWKSGIG
jgi:hypothetical protein